MNDIVHKTTKVVDHNRFKVLALVIVAGIMFGLYGCTPVTISPVSGDKVTVKELKAEVISHKNTLSQRKLELETELTKYEKDVAAFAEQVSLAEQDLQEQYEIRQEIATFVGDIIRDTASGDIDPIGVLGTGLMLGSSLLFGGAYADGRRKDKIIARKKATSFEIRPLPTGAENDSVQQ